MSWIYPPELVEGLSLVGITPSPEAAPAVTREIADDLYRDELRRLRARLLSGEFDRAHYVELIVALRKQFWVLTLPLYAWEKIVVEKPG